MKTKATLAIFLNSHRPFWRRLVFVVCLGLGLLTQSVKAQFYTTIANDSQAFYYFDFATSTWTAKANVPAMVDRGGSLVYAGQYIYATPGRLTPNLYRYDPTANTWTAMANAPGSIENGGKLVYDGGNYLYLLQGSGTGFFRYNISANTWSTMAVVPAAVAEGGAITFDGTYIYAFIGAGLGDFYRYDIAANTWTTRTFITFSNKPDDGASLIYVSPYIYAIPAGNPSWKVFFYRYDIAANTWNDVAVADAPFGFGDGAALVSDGAGNILGMGAGGLNKQLMQYNIAANTWQVVDLTIPVFVTEGGGAVYAAGCNTPVFTATAITATCSGTDVLSNGTLRLTAFDGSSKQVGYSVGSTYTGPAFASATAVTGSAPFTLTNTLANPTVAQPYTIRVFCDATTFADAVVTLEPKVCIVADLSLAISPATHSGNLGELATYTVTITNGGPNAAPDVKVSVPIPSNGTFVSASPQQGTYGSGTKIWTVGSLAVGSKTMTLTLRVN